MIMIIDEICRNTNVILKEGGKMSNVIWPQLYLFIKKLAFFSKIT